MRNFPNEVYEIYYENEVDKLSYSDKLKVIDSIDNYQWSDLIRGKPRWWEGMSETDRCEWLSVIYKRIMFAVGEKAVMRHRAKRDEADYTDQAFDDWWDSRCSKLQEEVHQSSYGSDDRRNRANNFDNIFKFVLPFVAET